MITRSTKWVSAIAALMLIATMATASLADHTAVADVSLGFPYTTDFNTDGGGWTASKPAPIPFAPVSSWAYGTPTSGPGIAFSGTKVWATNLTGAYSANECGALLSPPIDLTATTSASASFMQWRHMEQSTSTAFDAGLLLVTTNGGSSFSVVTPTGGYTSSAIGTTARGCLTGLPTGSKGLSGPTGTTPPAAVYTAVTTDLSAFAGQTVQFAIAFASDGSVHRTGWYIDDFAVTTDAGTTTETFEAGNGGFTLVSTKPPVTPLGWSHGTQTTGPGAGAPNSDPPLWATNLNGNYGPAECSAIESPPIALEPVGEDLGDLDDGLATVTATLNWDQWFQSSSVSAGGVVQVGEGGTYTNLAPTTGYNGNPTASLDACLQDDTQASGAFAGTTLNAPGGPMTPFSANLTAWVGKTITLRFLFASTTTAVLDEGWYVDNVNVELRARVAEPHVEEPPNSVPFTPIQDLYTEGFESGNGGYASGGTNSTWAHGVPVSPPTPAEGQGPSMWGTNLSGNYNNSECSWVKSPAIDLSSVPAGAPAGELARLSYAQWMETENSFDGGIVQASTDGGATWTTLTPVGGYDDTMFTAARACLGLSATDRAFTSATSSTPGSWAREAFDVTSYLGGSVTFRWLFATDTSVVKRGWYIDDVAVTLGAGATAPSLPTVPSEVPTALPTA